jgi:hypothetical protein
MVKNMLQHDPVVSDLNRQMRALDASTAQLDWEEARLSELELQYISEADFFDAVGRVEAEQRLNAMFLNLSIGRFEYARGCAAEVMLEAAKDFAECTLKNELEEMANSEPDLH